MSRSVSATGQSTEHSLSSASCLASSNAWIFPLYIEPGQALRPTPPPFPSFFYFLSLFIPPTHPDTTHTHTQTQSYFRLNSFTGDFWLLVKLIGPCHTCHTSCWLIPYGSLCYLSHTAVPLFLYFCSSTQRSFQRYFPHHLLVSQTTTFIIQATTHQLLD